MYFNNPSINILLTIQTLSIQIRHQLYQNYLLVQIIELLYYHEFLTESISSIIIISIMLKYSTIGDDDTSNVKTSKYTILDKTSTLDNNVENNLYTFILERILKCVIQVFRIMQQDFNAHKEKSM